MPDCTKDCNEIQSTIHPEAIVYNRRRNAPGAVEPGTSLMVQQRTLFFAHDKIAQQSQSARRRRAPVAAAGQGMKAIMTSINCNEELQLRYSVYQNALHAFVCL
jgi:hypothetical protein